MTPRPVAQADHGVFDVRFDYDTPERMWACVLLRDTGGAVRGFKKPWYLDGACVGLGSSPAFALADLLGVICYLVEHGENFLTQGPISKADRQWLREIAERAPDFDVVADPRPLEQIATEDHGAGTP